jgi:hypothetical protein
LVFTHDAARGTNDFLWGIFSLQNPTVRAGSAASIKTRNRRQTHRQTHTHVVIIYRMHAT